MRTPLLGSVAFVLLTLLGADALAAGSSPAAPLEGGATAKRVARRAALAPQPAPTPAEPLPAPPPSALPPALPISTTTTSSASVPATSAAEPPAAPVADEISPYGFVLAIGTSLVVPMTGFVEGSESLGRGIALDARAGYYLSKHVGIVGGFRGGLGHRVCSDDSCHGYSLQLPVMVQYSATNRTRGFYGEAGVGLFTTYSTSAGDATVTVSTPVELKLGAGYCLGGSGRSALDRALSADLRLGVDLGRMTSAEIERGSQSYSGSIDHPTVHVVVALGLMGHFAL